MPAVFHPDEVVEQSPSRQAEHAYTGGGRLPPIEPKHTGGGGDNDNWNNRPVGRRGPRERLETFRRGLFFALAGDAMFFVAIMWAFFATKHSGHIDAYNRYVHTWIPTAIPSVLWLNTACLFLSSLTIEAARRGMFHEIDAMEEWLGLGRPTRKRVLPWLLASMLLGAAFLWGQWIAWKQLAFEHARYSANQSARFFYLITGIHGAHLLLGLFALLAAAIGMRAVRGLQSRQILVDSAAWYWHTMGVLWVFLFGMLVYGQ